MQMRAAVISCFSKYATFRGRASRAEFWWWFLFTVLFSAMIGAFCAAANADPWLAKVIINLVVLIPSAAVAVRRLHDVNCSGSYMLAPAFVAIIAFVLAAVCNAFNPGLGSTAFIAALIATMVTFLGVQALYFKRGDDGENRYGESPYAMEQTEEGQWQESLRR